MWLENQKIWKFENPEDLAKALDNKNQNLADRIREISKTAIEKDSRDLRKVLQEELTPEEQSEIREALPESWVEKILDKKTSSDIGKEAVWDIIWEENADKIDTLTKKSEKLSKNFDKIWEIFKSKWIMAWLWAILLMFKGLFTWDFSWLDKILNPKKEWEKSWKKEAIIDSAKKAEYNLWLKALYLISGKEVAKKSSDVLLVDKIRENSFSNLKKEFSNKDWISKRLDVPTPYTDEEVYNWVKMLIDSENTLDGILSKVNKDWRELPIEEIINLLNKKWGWVLANMKEKVSNLNLDLTSPLQNIEKVFSSLSNMIDIKIEWWNINFWNLSDKAKLIEGVSNWTKINILSNSNSNITTSTDSSKAEISIAWAGWEKDKEFIKDLFSFKNSIIWPLSSLFPKDEQENIKSFFATKWFTLKELTELYLITAWETNISSLDWISKTLLYVKFWWILSKDTWLRWTFDTEIFNALLEKSESIKLPPEAKNFFNHILQWTLDTLKSAAWATIKEILWAIWNMSIENKLKIGWSIAAFCVLVYYSRALMTKVALWAAIAALVTSIYAIWRVEFEKAWLTEEKIRKWLEQDALNAWRVSKW